ncbi:MAG: phospholipase D-like domain-containing protein [Mucilaginibacter sp.]
MRVKNIASELEVYAVSGTNTVVISLDMKHKPADLLGFAFERVETVSKKRIWLEGQKFFNSIVKIDKKDLAQVKGQKYPTYIHPVQSFLWKDFTVTPGLEYTYIITALKGASTNPDRSLQAQITIKAEMNIAGVHGVYFNRGVSGSQFYSEQFGFDKPFDADESVVNQKAVDWLSRGLYEGMVSFLSQAQPGQKIRGACYEFHYPAILQLLKRLQTGGVDVNIVYDAKNYGDENKAALAATHSQSLVTTVRDNEVTQAHNKFFILIDHNDKALKVWTGSTNISAKGIFGHCDTGHIISDPPTAEKYYAYWKLVDQNLGRDAYRAAVMKLKDCPDIKAADIQPGISVFFSPRANNNMLDQYAALIDEANQMVCCIYPFNVDKRFQEVFEKDKPYIRYILLDKKAKFNTFQTDDKDVEVTAGAYIHSPVDNWVAETSAGKLIKSGVDFLHNKIILIDPLGQTPIVISGSANYSTNSTSLNDENTLVIKGDQTVADKYFTEYVRLFDHFSFREWLNSNVKNFNPFLAEDGSWVNGYFDSPDALNVKRKLIFKNMTGATIITG